MYRLLLAFSIFAFPLFAQDIDAGQAAQNALYSKQVKSMQDKAMQEELKKQQAVTAKAPQNQEVMIIEPLARAQDLLEAFTYLRSKKPSSPVVFHLASGKIVTSVMDVSVMKGGSLVIFTTNTTQGIKYEVVKTEDIATIGHE